MTSLEKQQPGPPDRPPPPGRGAEEGSASQAQPRALREPPPPRPPLPRRASDSAPLPQPAAKCPRRRPEKQEVQAGAQGQTRPGSPSHPRAAPRPPPSAPRPAARPRSPRGRAEGERAPGRRDGCDPFLPPLSGDSPALTAPSGRHPAPGPRTSRRPSAPACSAATLSPPLPERTRTCARPDGAARAGHPSPRPALPGFPGSQRRGVPVDGETARAARRGRDDGGPAPAGSLGPRTHLSFSAGALAALRGVSSAAGQGHAPDVSTQGTQGWVPAEEGGARRPVLAQRLEAGPEFIWPVTAHAPTNKAR
ncbi:basic salivary proline-rich protein 4-like [Lontra canadensis]|uniref:basic salivary proline-rich protein 4-like n=1 Tax=Lontra canadensis TaxID=76717 RepID=UPI0013F35288|nr:basic salivary proline-rich protein 4-like [Lontra canadensis]